MFTANAETEDDMLRSRLFYCLTTFAQSTYFSNKKKWKHGAASYDFISEAYTYITRDRPLQINDFIETELDLKVDDDLMQNIEEQDLQYLAGIIKYRKIIFDMYE